jgi:hypothetical protein
VRTTSTTGEKGETLAQKGKEMAHPMYYLKFKEDPPKEKIEEILAGWYREP